MDRDFREPEPKPLPTLPLPHTLKQRSLSHLRRAGLLEDEALLLLLDGSYTSLVLRGCRRLSADSLSLCPMLCPGLTSLDLSWCWQLTSLDLGFLPQLVNLRGVALCGCWKLESASLWPLLDSCPSLLTCNLGGCDGLDAAPHAAGFAAPGRLLSRLAPLQPALRPNGGGSGEATAAQASQGVGACGEAEGPARGAAGGAEGGGLGRLRVLDLRGSALPAEAVAQLPLVAPRLLALLLREAPAVSDGAVDALLRACPVLQLLDLSGSAGGNSAPPSGPG